MAPSHLTLYIDTFSINTLGVLSQEGWIHKWQSITPGPSSRHSLFQELLTLLKTFPLEHFSEIWINRGPGSFTGLRVGLALAQGLALAATLPIYTLDSLSLLAALAPLHPHQNPKPLLFARQGFVYCSSPQMSLQDSHASNLESGQCLPLETLTLAFPNTHSFVTAREGSSFLPKNFQYFFIDDHYPWEAIPSLINKNTPSLPHEIQPLYLAEPNIRKKTETPTHVPD